MSPLIPRSDLVEALVWTLALWRERHASGATIDEFARRELHARERRGEEAFDLSRPSGRQAAEWEYSRLYILSIELANRGLLRPGLGSPTIFHPMKPWFSKHEDQDDTNQAEEHHSPQATS